MASEGLNKVQLIGNLGADPELKYGASGAAVLRMRLATTERFMSKDGERQERTEWHSVIFFGKRAEGLGRVLEKGATVYVEGRLQTRQWEDRDGNKRYTTEVVGDGLLFLGGRRGESRGEERQDRGESRGGGLEDFPADNFGDDDIPFAVNVVEHGDPCMRPRDPSYGIVK